MATKPDLVYIFGVNNAYFQHISILINENLCVCVCNGVYIANTNHILTNGVILEPSKQDKDSYVDFIQIGAI